jgi:hypothetical protein
MSLVKLAISSAPARLAMQKGIIEQAGAKAGALYSAASSKAAGGIVNKGLFSQLKATGVQRANPLQQVAKVEASNIKPLVNGLTTFGKPKQVVSPLLQATR